MAIARQKRLAKLETQTKGDQIPIICEHESDVAATIDAMIAAGELTEADRRPLRLLAGLHGAPTPRATTT